MAPYSSVCPLRTKMNTETRKKLLKLIFPGIILTAMVVLIVMARHRDAQTTANKLAEKQAAKEASAAAAESSTESSAPAAEAAEDEDAIPVDGDAAEHADLEDPKTTCYDDKMSISFVGFDEANSLMGIRIDNRYGESISTQGHPMTTCDGEAVLLNPLGKNQKLNYICVEDGCYHIVWYKVDARCFTCESLVLEGTMKIDSNEEMDTYELIIK